MERKKLRAYAINYSRLQEKFNDLKEIDDDYMRFLEFLSIEFLGKKAYTDILNHILDGDMSDVFSGFVIKDIDLFCDRFLPVINSKTKIVKCAAHKGIDGMYSVIPVNGSEVLAVLSPEEASDPKYRGVFDYEKTKS